MMLVVWFYAGLPPVTTNNASSLDASQLIITTISVDKKGGRGVYFLLGLKEAWYLLATVWRMAYEIGLQAHAC